MNVVQMPKRRGRPTGRRGTFTFRCTPSLREKLDAASVAEQRPVSEVIENRLERAFWDAERTQSDETSELADLKRRIAILEAAFLARP